MQDNEVGLEQLKSVYKAQTEAYLDFNMALINILTNQKEIITLFYINYMTYPEIATLTGRREDAIRQLHSRALKKLRAHYEKHNE